MRDPLSLIAEAISADTYIAQQNRFRALANKPPLTPAEENVIRAKLPTTKMRATIDVFEEQEPGSTVGIDYYRSIDLDTKNIIVDKEFYFTVCLKKTVDRGYTIYDRTLDGIYSPMIPAAVDRYYDLGKKRILKNEENKL